ncbi:MAG: Crp/Fnr family transcriptional regulator [Pseudomonadota bacterium]
MTTSWIDSFFGLSRLPLDIRAELGVGSEIVSMPIGTKVFAPGQSNDTLLLLLEGTVRVQQRSETGKEVILYRVNAGESCVMSTACMLAYEDYSADGIAETDVKAVAIPRSTFDGLVAKSSVFREFVFSAYSRRMTDLFKLIDDLIFQRVDVRLASRLLSLADTLGEVRATHAALATELGTAREVISRTLSEFQRREWVAQSRGVVRITQREALERLVRSSGGEV